MMSEQTGEQTGERMDGDDVVVKVWEAHALGDLVQHVDDPEVRGKVIGIRGEGGRCWVRLAGVANWLPAEAVEKVRE
jgi:hypothetical protein